MTQINNFINDKFCKFLENYISDIIFDFFMHHSLQQVSCFFSRYKVIVYSATNRTPQRLSGAIAWLVIVWTLSLILSFPLFFAMKLEIIPMSEQLIKVIGDDSIAYCAEKWGEYEKGRLIFSCFTLVVQVRDFRNMLSVENNIS